MNRRSFFSRFAAVAAAVPFAGKVSSSDGPELYAMQPVRIDASTDAGMNGFPVQQYDIPDGYEITYITHPYFDATAC